MKYEVGICRLKELLASIDMNQNQLAEILGVSESTISEYVHNKHIMNLRTARNVAAIIGCGILDLYEWTEE